MAGDVRVGEGLGIGVWLEMSGWVRAWGLVCGRRVGCRVCKSWGTWGAKEVCMHAGGGGEGVG